MIVNFHAREHVAFVGAHPFPLVPTHLIYQLTSIFPSHYNIFILFHYSVIKLRFSKLFKRIYEWFIHISTKNILSFWIIWLKFKFFVNIFKFNFLFYIFNFWWIWLKFKFLIYIFNFWNFLLKFKISNSWSRSLAFGNL